MRAPIVPSYMTLQQAIEITGLSASTLRRRIRDGSLAAGQPGGKRKRWLIPAEALASLHLGNDSSLLCKDNDPSEGVPGRHSKNQRQPKWTKKLPH